MWTIIRYFRDEMMLPRESAYKICPTDNPLYEASKRVYHVSLQGKAI
jgi:hypothetical protein